METTMQSSLPIIRSKLALLEAIELASLGMLIWYFMIDVIKTPDTNLLDLLIALAVYEGLLIGSWAIYNGYIRIARACGRRVGTRLWIITIMLTGSYTFWSWIILDVNRFLMSKIFYRGEVPVEYAWNWRSREVRKAWEEARKAGQI